MSDIGTLTGRELHLVSYPDGAVRPTDFEVVTAEVGELRPGEVLVANTWMSIDPGLRLRLRPESPEGYFPAMPLGCAMSGILTVGEVIESCAEGFEPGDTVSHAFGWRDSRLSKPARPRSAASERCGCSIRRSRRPRYIWARSAAPGSPLTPGCCISQSFGPAMSCGCRPPAAQSATWPPSSRS